MKKNGTNGHHPAVDSNEAAKQNGAIKIEEQDVAILNALITDRQRHANAAQQAQQNIQTFLYRCAQARGLTPEEFTFSDKDLAFVPVAVKVK